MFQVVVGQVDSISILVKQNNARLGFFYNAATAGLAGIDFFTHKGNQDCYTDEQDRLTGNVDQRAGIGKQVKVRNALIQDGTGACQPESPFRIKIGCIDDREIEEWAYNVSREREMENRVITKHTRVKDAIIIKRVKSVCETEYPENLMYGFMPTLYVHFQNL